MIRSVAVIGAGAAGMISSLVLLQNGFQVTVYEQSNDVGGVWNYSPGSSAMYESLRTNLPKEIMAFNQQNPFDASSSSFPTHYEVQAYLRSLADTYRIRHLIKFRHKVVNISKIATDHCEKSSLTTNRDHWILQWEAVPNNDVNGGTGTDFFDAVLVCNGVPFLPKMPTLGYFKGISIHSNQYDQVKHSLWDKRVLIVGTKSSGTDIARELLSIAAAVHISDRNYVLDIIDSATQGTEALSSKVLMHPAIGEIDAESSAVIFADGSKVCDLDAIIWCTGYVYDFPFLADKRSGVKSSLTDSCAEGTIDQSLIVPVPSAGDIPTAVQVEEGKRVRPLYQQLFAIEDHSLVFVGLPFKVVPFPLFYLQAEYVAAVFTGKVQLPDVSGRYAWLASFEEQLMRDSLYHDKYHFLGGDPQWEYCRFLATASGLVLTSVLAEDTKEKGTATVDATTESRVSSKVDIMRYITVLEEIYNDNMEQRPPGCPADTDHYRSRRYTVDWENYTWSVQ